jgi:hypothetical protein
MLFTETEVWFWISSLSLQIVSNLAELFGISEYCWSSLKFLVSRCYFSLHSTSPFWGILIPSPYFHFPVPWLAVVSQWISRVPSQRPTFQLLYQYSGNILSQCFGKQPQWQTPAVPGCRFHLSLHHLNHWWKILHPDDILVLFTAPLALYSLLSRHPRRWLIRTSQVLWLNSQLFCRLAVIHALGGLQKFSFTRFITSWCMGLMLYLASSFFISSSDEAKNSLSHLGVVVVQGGVFFVMCVCTCSILRMCLLVYRSGMTPVPLFPILSESSSHPTLCN